MSPDVRRASLTGLKAPEAAQRLKKRRGREGTQKHARHAGHAELRESAGSMMKEYGERSTPKGRGRRLRT